MTEVRDQPAIAMTRPDAAALIQAISDTVGYRADLERLPSGAPSGPVWVVRARHLLTGTTRIFRSTEEWLRFRDETKQEVRGMMTNTTERPARPAEPASNGIALERPAALAPAVPAPTAISGVPAGSPFDFARWKASTELALRHVEGDEQQLRQRLVAFEQQLRQRLVAFEEEVARRRSQLKRETADAIASREREAKLLRRALAVVAQSATADERSARDAAGAQRPSGAPGPGVKRCMDTILEYARAHPEGFRTSACQEAVGQRNGSTYFGALKNLIASGELEKPEAGFYRLTTDRPVLGPG